MLRIIANAMSSSNGRLPGVALSQPFPGCLSKGTEECKKMAGIATCSATQAVSVLNSVLNPISQSLGYCASPWHRDSCYFRRLRILRRCNNCRLLTSPNCSPSPLGFNAASCSRFLLGKFPGRAVYDPVTIACAPCSFVTHLEPNTNAVRSRVDSAVEILTPALDDGKLLKAMVYEAQHGFSNVSGISTRFGDFLVSQLSLRSSMAGGSFSSLEDDAKLYDQMASVDRAHLLDRVAQVMGFLDIQDLMIHHVALREASQDLQEPPKRTLAKQSGTATRGVESKLSSDQRQGGEDGEGDGCQRSTQQASLKPLPSGIVFGSSEPVELYNPTANGTSNSGLDASSAGCNDGISAGMSDCQVGAVHEKVVRQARKKVTKTSVGGRSIRTRTNGDHAVVLDRQSSHTVALGAKIHTERCDVYKDYVLDTPVSVLKDFSSYQRSRLDENGFHTVRKLLQHFPRAYVNFQQAGQKVEDGLHLSFVGTITSSKGIRLGPSLAMVEVVVKSKVDLEQSPDENGDYEEEDSAKERKIVFLHLKKFFRGARFTNPWFLNKMSSKNPVSAQVAVSGKVKALPLEDHFEIREYNLEFWDRDSDDPGLVASTSEEKSELEMTGKPYPVYSAKGGLQPKTIEFCIQRILPELPMDLDPLPKDVREKCGLVELRQAYLGIHTPSDAKHAEQARQRLVFDEFLYLQLGLLLQRQQLTEKYLGEVGMANVAESGMLEMEKWSPLALKLMHLLPYSLTQSQIRATSEIMWDLQSAVPMSRLLQGDVGCGKTIVAFLALLEVIDAGYQGALMAPTEFLAFQHHERITGWLEMLEEKERPRVALLTGSTPLSKARTIRNGLESGEISLAVGTHSLISDSVRFASLGLAVVDEQHRFGVAQRGRLNNKVRDAGILLGEENEEASGDAARSEGTGGAAAFSSAPHVLAMSATPIPRTLALAMHGDMSISQITELPPGRPSTITHAFHGSGRGRQEAYEMLRKELESGGRVFVVYPVIEPCEDLPDVRAAETEFDRLTKEFDDFQCGLVHGRMKAHEKEAVMERFKSGAAQVLVSTTVIEVGIDIPEASMIVIENAERYGMAQLHQLRGRVGRGSRDSTCILLGSTPGSLNRLKLLELSRDGFYLAEMDLRLRGPGEILGKRQSGHLPEFGIARLDQDGEILERARTAAEDLLNSHPGLKDIPRLKQELSMRRPPSALS